MDNLSNSFLCLVLIICLLISAFFSGSETAMMAQNRYKLKHLAEKGEKSALRVQKLLEKTEALLGTILLGNNFVNILATAVGTVIGIRLFGDAGVLVATVFLTIVVLIFSELLPKTIAANYADRLSLIFSSPLKILVFLLSPLVKMLNFLVSKILKILKISELKNSQDALSDDELKTVVLSASLEEDEESNQQDMILGVLELSDVLVEEVMIPHTEIEGLDLRDSWEEIIKALHQGKHSRILVYEEKLDNVLGMIYLRDVMNLYRDNEMSVENLKKILHPCLFIPESTPLKKQLINFREEKQRIALVVDEYGDIQGLITLEDILNYIFGNISDKNIESVENPEIVENNGVFTVDGGISLRSLNKKLGLNLSTESANTLSGLIIETLANFPQQGTEIKLENCLVKVKKFTHGVVELAEIKIEGQ